MTKISEELAMVYRNKKDKRGIVVRNKASLVAQHYAQEEGINYDEFFAPVARIEAIRLFLAYASFMGFIVYHMDVKSAFLYGTVEEERDDGIISSQDKYVADILKKFDFVTMKTTSTLIETRKAFLKDEVAEDVDVYLYRSMIGSLLYLTTSRPDIMFTVCACARDSPFDLEAFLIVIMLELALKGNPQQESRIDGRTCNIKQKCMKSQIPRQSKRGRDTKIPQSGGPPEKVGDETIHKELGDRMERAAYTTSS
ncbi:uncharacterized mitochondrial protein-like protein [Tanacetum coccineum]